VLYLLTITLVTACVSCAVPMVPDEVSPKHHRVAGSTKSGEVSRDVACTRGQASACLALARAYAYGRGVTRSDQRAFEYFKQACERGSATGCTDMGYRLFNGKGVPRDRGCALSFYRRGCHGGNQLGCNNLASAYENGSGVKRDRKRAFVLYESACKKGQPLACANLGRVHRFGRGVKKSYATAKDLLERSCGARVALGCYNLAWMHARGEGLVVDSTRALELFRTACSMRSTLGCRETKRYALARKALVGGTPGCRLDGLWQPKGPTMTASARPGFRVGKLTSYGTSVMGSVGLPSAGDRASFAASDGKVTLHGDLEPDQVGLLRLKQARKVSSVLWLRPPARLAWRSVGKGKVVVEPLLPSSLGLAQPLRASLPCAAFALVAALEHRLPSQAEEVSGETTPHEVELSRASITFSARPGGRGAVRLDLSSKYALRKAHVLEERGGHARVRTISRDYVLEGWVHKRLMTPKSLNPKSKTSGVFGVGGLLGSLLGRGSTKTSPRKCNRDLSLYANDGQRKVPVGMLHKGTRFFVQRDISSRWTEIVIPSLSWLRLESGVNLVLSSSDLELCD